MSPSPNNQKPPIFIVGPARSGTTLMRWALDTHPNIVCRSEQNFLRGIVLAFKQEFLELPTGEVFDETKLNQLYISYGMQTSPRVIARRFRTLHESFYLDLCRQTQKDRWADNTHSINDFALPVIDVMYDHTPVYIMLFRHGLDATLSAQEKFNQSIRESFQYWCAVTDLQLAFSELHPERCLTVRYEELARDPQTIMDSVFRFLDEEPVPDLEEKVFSQDHGPTYGDHKIQDTRGIHAFSVDKWRKVSPSVYQDAVAEFPEFSQIMARLGYGTS